MSQPYANVKSENINGIQPVKKKKNKKDNLLQLEELRRTRSSMLNKSANINSSRNQISQKSNNDTDIKRPPSTNYLNYEEMLRTYIIKSLIQKRIILIIY